MKLRRKLLDAAAVLILALGAATQAGARVVSLEILQTGPAFGGQSFGNTGSYQLLQGRRAVRGGSRASR